MRSVDEQVAMLMQGAEFGDVQIYDAMKAELRQRLAEGHPLRVYCGYDPTAPDIHLGHTVTMRKLRQFQDLGHEVTFLIGTFTGLVGDPSDRDSARPQQTSEQAAENARTYAEQAFKVLDRDRTQIRYNDAWLGRLTFADVIRLASHFTVQQFLARDNLSRRHSRGDPIWLHELFYALMQGYDAVALQSDVQLGATEQLFNLLAGRKLQEAFGLRPQVCLTFPILVGTDGHQRMSKSTGNYIGLNEPPQEQFGKIMSLPDHVMTDYFRLVTRYEPHQVEAIEQALADGSRHPMEVKMELAREIVTLYHGEEVAGQAENHFRQVFQQGQLPQTMPVYRLSAAISLVDLMAQAGLARSKSDARRLIEQRAVSLDGARVNETDCCLEPGTTAVLRVGRRRFLRILGK